MQSDFKDQYRFLRDEFRRTARGGCINVDSEMNRAAFNSSWPSPTGLDQSAGTSGHASSSSMRTTPKSSDSSHSPEDAGTTTIIIRHGVALGTENGSSSSSTPPLRDQTAEPEDILEDGLPSHRPRKGHKKSRGGCFNCKRRKIKVCGAVQLISHLTTLTNLPHSVKRINLHVITVQGRIWPANTQLQKHYLHCGGLQCIPRIQ